MKKFVLLVSIICFGCSDAEMAQWSAVGNEHRIELWSGGTKVHEWTSTGKVHTEENSDGYYFKDKDTEKLIRVTGDLVVTPISKE